MTIRDCPKCGGNHFGSFTCPMEDPPGTHAPKPQAAPSVPDAVREWEGEADNYLKRDPLRLAGNRMRDELTSMAGELKRRQELDNVTTLGVPGEATYPAPAHGWTCFHCGQTFHTAFLAEQHFGSFPKGTPACRFKGDFDLLEKFRAAESQITAQAKTIETLRALATNLSEQGNIEAESFARICNDRDAAKDTVTELRAEIERRRLLANEDNETIAAQAAEVERLTGRLGEITWMADERKRLCHEAIDNMTKTQELLVVQRLRAEAAESSLETARGALEKCEAELVATTGDLGKIGKRQMEVLASAVMKFAPDLAKELTRRFTEADGALDEFLAVLRAPRAALPSPPITKIKGEG